MVSSQNEIKRLEELNTNHKNELQDKLSQIEASKIDSKRRLDELQSFIQETDSELQSLEKEGRDAKDRIEHEELEMNIIKNRIKEDNMKTEQEIADIVEMMHLVETKFIEQADRLHSELCAH
jgi:predicted nuclease with TOPRIM domain